jgi:predicted site-specific integrase-resolvase
MNRQPRTAWPSPPYGARSARAACCLLPALRTLGGHRRYASEAVPTASQAPAAGKTVCHAPVSSHDQSAQLQTQAARLERHCQEAGVANVEVVTDLGSGLNYRKTGLQRILVDILRGRVSRLVIATKDRLMRKHGDWRIACVQLDAVIKSRRSTSTRGNAAQ